ncbi:TPA: acylphosphatase [Candidatus Poribacteria bacterium]|nr:acylphosphatase [Candidatus Poribacteria bacterium]
METTPDYKQYHILVSGWVQGVGFRYFARARAMMLGIKGYVRNLRSGQVEVVAEGSKSDLETFVHYLRRGPEFSRVTDVKIEEQPYSGRYHNFRVRY